MMPAAELFDFSSDDALGQSAHDLAARLWPINRSLTGPGVVETLNILAEDLPALTLHTVPSGTQAFDWIVPQEWRVNAAYLIAPDGTKLCDFAENNLHLVGYSQPMQGQMSLDDLQPHLHSLPDQPDAIPYVTSYYGKAWGFCLNQKQRDALSDGTYQVVIDTEHFDGVLTYADLVLPGETTDEVLISTYICHPSMANNELSGPVVSHALARIVAAQPRRRYTYRFVFVPETIGALVYLSRNLQHLKTHVKAGFVMTCVGDERARSFLPSRAGHTLADRAARTALRGTAHDVYSFLQRGSDERQYCAPGIDLPVCSIMNSKYGTFPEYHTSHDDLNFVTPRGLAAAIGTHRSVFRILEQNSFPRITVLGEPQLGRRGLYSNLSKVGSAAGAMTMRNLLAYADGQSDLIDLANQLDVPFAELAAVCALLSEHGLIRLSPEPCDPQDIG
ncbi:MAG: DUF4910 domain-containing protein [Pseudomonadota bacterium]